MGLILQQQCELLLPAARKVKKKKATLMTKTIVCVCMREATFEPFYFRRSITSTFPKRSTLFFGRATHTTLPSGSSA